MACKKKHNAPVAVFVGGGSGGHIVPALVLAKRWQETHQDGTTWHIALEKPLDRKILKDTPHSIFITQAPLSSSPLKLARCLFDLVKNFFSSLLFFLKNKPEDVVSTGSLVSIPVCLAAYFLRIPITLYELNAQPGKAAGLLNRFATHTHVVFKECLPFLPGSILTEYPHKFTQADLCYDKKNLIEHEFAPYGFKTNFTTILILGGSQGSRSLNEAFKSWVKTNSPHSIQVIHQTGSSDSYGWSSFYASHGVPACVFSYKDDLKMFYQLADAIICRAGAGTLFEIQFFNKPCLIIPLETSTTSHQVDNARSLAQSNSRFHVLVEGKNNEVAILSALSAFLKSVDSTSE